MELWEIIENENMEKIKGFIAFDSNLNKKDESGRTLLHYAAQHGKPEIVELLLQAGADINAITTDGSTPLAEAVENCHQQIASLLLEQGADPNLGKTTQGTTLHIAAINGDITIGRLLLEHGAGINALDNEADCWTPLHCAAYFNRLEFVKLLVQFGADIYAMSELGWPMDKALDQGHKEVAEFLYQIVESQHPGSLGTPLHAAAGLRNINLISRFISSNPADVRDFKKQTPLHWTVGHERTLFFQIILEQSNSFRKNELPSEYKRGECKDVIEYLLAHKADIEAKDYANNTPLLIALQWGQIDAANVLISQGADVNAADNTGWTPVILAASGGYLEILKVLLNRGANINAVRNGWNALNQASHMGKENIVRFLLEYGMDVNGPGQRTTFSYPLLSAIFMEHLSIVKILLEHGAETNIQDNAGNTPLSLAKENTQMIKLLKCYGAAK